MKDTHTEKERANEDERRREQTGKRRGREEEEEESLLSLTLSRAFFSSVFPFFFSFQVLFFSETLNILKRKVLGKKFSSSSSKDKEHGDDDDDDGRRRPVVDDDERRRRIRSGRRKDRGAAEDEEHISLRHARVSHKERNPRPKRRLGESSRAGHRVHLRHWKTGGFGFSVSGR
jgi:hypothetical protein